MMGESTIDSLSVSSESWLLRLSSFWSTATSVPGDLGTLLHKRREFRGPEKTPRLFCCSWSTSSRLSKAVTFSASAFDFDCCCDRRFACFPKSALSFKLCALIFAALA